MWYSNAVDAAKGAQLGRLRITLTQGSVMDCGDTSLDLNAADLDNTVDPARNNDGQGSVLVGGVAISSTQSGTAAISINGLVLLVLRKPPGVLDLSSDGDCLAVGLSNTSNMWSCLNSFSCPPTSPFVCTRQGNKRPHQRSYAPLLHRGNMQRVNMQRGLRTANP
jgi:hypothetical protein